MRFVDISRWKMTKNCTECVWQNSTNPLLHWVSCRNSIRNSNIRLQYQTESSLLRDVSSPALLLTLSWLLLPLFLLSVWRVMLFGNYSMSRKKYRFIWNQGRYEAGSFFSNNNNVTKTYPVGCQGAHGGRFLLKRLNYCQPYTRPF